MARLTVGDILKRLNDYKSARLSANGRATGETPILKAGVGGIFSNKETTGDLVRVDIVNPSDEKVNDMLDYCQENSISLERFINDFYIDGISVAIFIFYNEHDALAFKLKFS
jgi:hypothetical protein